MVCLFVRLHVLVVGLLLLACLLASLFLSFFLLIVCLFQCTRNAHYFLCRLTTGVVDIFSVNKHQATGLWEVNSETPRMTLDLFHDTHQLRICSYIRIRGFMVG